MKNVRAMVYIIIIGTVIICGIVFFSERSNYVDVSQKVNIINKIDYPNNYVNQNQNKVNVDIPMSYELLNVIIALGNKEETSSSLTNTNTEYYQKVINYFYPYVNHEAVKRVKALNDTGDYTILRYIYIYNLIENELELNPNYPDKKRIDDLAEYIPLISDFAKKTDFEKFYYDNKEIYEEEINLFLEFVDINGMWQWLEKNFTPKYSSQKIILSPLVSGAHNTIGYSDIDSDFSEIVIFVSTPGLLNKDKYNSEMVYKGLIERMVFTEMDHHYVNPTTNLDSNYLRIMKQFKNVSYWNKGKGYKKEILTFNEYMTWATFLIYAQEKYPSDCFLDIKETTIDIMEYRGFIHFEDFADKLIQLRIEQNQISVEKLYPLLLDKLNN